MNVLIACEYSGVVRNAFRALGHNAWSCDLLESEDNSEYHYIGDVFDFIDKSKIKWDLMIAHPPCTYLANSSAKHLYNGMSAKNGINQDRWNNMVDGANFFKRLLELDIPRICIENPIMLGHAKKIIGVKQSQIIQPWQFGHGEIKATCLWLKNLPLLKPTQIVNGRHARVHLMGPSPDRWKERSRTLKGIGEAFAAQWGIF